jgi:hypothetical protein
MSALLCAALAGAVWLLPDQVLAQTATVQQPAIGVFSVDTVVSVPDRGRMFPGGVRSAGSLRSSYGFGPVRQSAFSHFATSGGADVGVYIFDFEAMNQALLDQLPAGTKSPAATPRAEDAWLYQERRRPVATQVVDAPSGRARDGGHAVASGHGPPTTEDAAQQAAFYLERGRSAESKGKDGAAALCYRMAVKYGSRDAADRLAAIAAK